MEPNQQDRLKRLVRKLAHKINAVFSESSEIKEALKDFEDEGYHVDVVLASITRVLRKEEETEGADPDPLKFELSPFDRAFLEQMRVLWKE